MARYIDAEHLFKCETCRHHRSGGCDTWCENGECYSPDMSKIPTADVVEVKHGYWKECFEDWRKQIAGDECSACGFQHYGTCISHYHYCPNCGAKMDEKKVK